MKKYYFDFVVEKLKKDIIQEFKNYTIDEEIIQREVNLYFLENKIEFKENEEKKIDTSTHKIRDRNAYKHRDNMCKARIWNEGDGGQCSNKGSYQGFCKTHFNKGAEKWWLGTIDEPRPERPVKPDGTLLTWNHLTSTS